MSDEMRDLLKALVSGVPGGTWVSGPYVTRHMVKANLTEEMTLVPGEVPMVKIEWKDDSGLAVFIERYSLAAIDEKIGKLIGMRDLLAKLEKQDE